MVNGNAIKLWEFSSTQRFIIVHTDFFFLIMRLNFDYSVMIITQFLGSFVINYLTFLQILTTNALLYAFLFFYFSNTILYHELRHIRFVLFIQVYYGNIQWCTRLKTLHPRPYRGSFFLRVCLLKKGAD